MHLCLRPHLKMGYTPDFAFAIAMLQIQMQTLSVKICTVPIFSDIANANAIAFCE